MSEQARSRSRPPAASSDAKRLLDTTDDTMTEIAFRAGFGSVRRFNAAFADLYGRSPSSLRAKPRRRWN